jgi:hypothetical protein
MYIDHLELPLYLKDQMSLIIHRKVPNKCFRPWHEMLISLCGVSCATKDFKKLLFGIKRTYVLCKHASAMLELGHLMNIVKSLGNAFVTDFGWPLWLVRLKGWGVAAGILDHAPWRWRHLGPPKRWFPTTLLHGVATQKTTAWIFYTSWSRPVFLSLCATIFLNSNVFLRIGQ